MSASPLGDPGVARAIGPTDAERRGALRRMKRFALALLVLAAIVFVVAKRYEDGRTWLGYVRAFAEAAMVGALADWFAVTALFRHPLRIPIPHTAIIPKRKAEIGQGLGTFVQENFLTPAVLGSKVRNAQPTRRALEWVEQPGNRQRAGAFGARAVTAVMDALDDEEMQAFLETRIRQLVRETPAAPLIGRVLVSVADDGRKELALHALFGKSVTLLHDNRDRLYRQFVSESPWWVPEGIDERVFDRLFNGFVNLFGELRDNPAHELRADISQRLDAFFADLQKDPQMLARGEEMKEELLDHPAVGEWASKTWRNAKTQILAEVNDPTSELRVRSLRALDDQIVKLRANAEQQARIDAGVERVVVAAVDRYGHEVADLITQTVERWDARETVDRIETQIGRDLQFIRINGTIVGGLAGLIIHAVSQLL